MFTRRPADPCLSLGPLKSSSKTRKSMRGELRIEVSVGFTPCRLFFVCTPRNIIPMCWKREWMGAGAEEGEDHEEIGKP